MDPEFDALVRRQSVERNRLFLKFLLKHPTVEVDNDDWTPEQEADWRELTAAHDAECRRERDELGGL